MHAFNLPRQPNWRKPAGGRPNLPVFCFPYETLGAPLFAEKLAFVFELCSKRWDSRTASLSLFAAHEYPILHAILRQPKSLKVNFVRAVYRFREASCLLRSRFSASQ